MNRFRGLALAVWLATVPVGSVSLTACQTTTTQTAELTAAQAAFVAEASYNGFARAAVAVETSGALTDAQKLQLKNIDDQAYNSLLAVRAGKASVDTLLSIIAQAQPLMKKVNP